MTNTKIKEKYFHVFFSLFNPFSPSQLSTPNFSLHITYQIKHLEIRKRELIKQSKLLKIKNKILSNLMKSIGSSWENLITQLGLKGLNKHRILITYGCV